MLCSFLEGQFFKKSNSSSSHLYSSYLGSKAYFIRKWVFFDHKKKMAFSKLETYFQIPKKRNCTFSDLSLTIIFFIIIFVLDMCFLMLLLGPHSLDFTYKLNFMSQVKNLIFKLRPIQSCVSYY